MIYLALAILTIGLIILSWFDLKYFLLPDCLTMPLLWLGLLINAFHLFTTPTAAILGAISGYLSLWIIARIFKLIRGIDGIGYGDFKLLAVFGAWGGWQILPFVIGGAAALGLIIATILLLMRKITKTQPIPFGPFIALAGWSSIFLQHLLNYSYR